MNTDLNMTTSERLLAVADLIEAHPERWDQQTWADTSDDTPESPTGQVGRGPECGTTACVAGWAVRLSPSELIDGELDWEGAGAVALGLSPDLAKAIFAGSYAPVSMPATLRLLAGLAEPRTLLAAIRAGANLRGADLGGADLTCADLGGADLTCANLTCANLRDADLGGANLGPVGTRARRTVTIPAGWTITDTGTIQRTPKAES